MQIKPGTGVIDPIAVNERTKARAGLLSVHTKNIEGILKPAFLFR